MDQPDAPGRPAGLEERLAAVEQRLSGLETALDGLNSLSADLQRMAAQVWDQTAMGRRLARIEDVLLDPPAAPAGEGPRDDDAR